MGPFSVFTVFVVVIYVFGAVDKTSSLVFQRTVKGNFIIIIIIIIWMTWTYTSEEVKTLREL